MQLGGMAGSLGRNQRFASTIASLVGDEQWMPLKKSRAYYLAEKQFDREIKRAFRGILSETYFVNFPMAKLKDDPDSKLESSTWTMTGYVCWLTLRRMWVSNLLIFK